MDLFCNRCTLQFYKKYAFDLHLSLVHGENIQEPQTSEQVFSDHLVDTGLKCNICSSVFKIKGNLKKHIVSVHKGEKPF